MRSERLVPDVINVVHKDNFVAFFSNFPTSKETLNRLGIKERVDLRVFDYFVKEVVIPKQGFDLDDTRHMNRRQLHIKPTGNIDLDHCTIQFKADARMVNYFLIYSYIRQMRTQLADVEVYRRNVINELYIELSDNNGRKTTRLVFKNLFPLSLDNLQFTSGDSSELTFNVNFAYEDFFPVMLQEDGRPLYDHLEDDDFYDIKYPQKNLDGV